jgi:1,4-alpha-glucan branching enzyme
MTDPTPEHLWYFNEGTDRHAYRTLGAHPGPDGTTFAVWAPNALSVAAVGDFDDWGRGDHHLQAVGSTGVWAGTVPAAQVGHRYKYRITTRDLGVIDKADPFAVRSEEPPATASIIDDPQHDWRDGEWMQRRGRTSTTDAPVSIYEVHLGSWGRTVSGGGTRFPNYVELGESLALHCSAHGFTHVELLPVMEHPFYGSWGYQVSGYFAPTARYGSPTDLMQMIDTLHQAGVGVILDWVPSHFPDDAFALSRFDGTHLYEHADPREGYHPDWGSSIFNYGRNEVRSFLLSSAVWWLERYHADGIRVDAVASMLYRDYSRKEGEWIPNKFGGRENLEAIDFLKQFNEVVYGEFPDVQTYAEESTAFPGVSRPTYTGGLGFGYKWDMGWMHDSLAYLREDPIHRRWHHGELTFRSVYAFSENFTLPLSHDEVVHGKGSLLDQMPGDRWQQLANLRLLYAYQWTQPGKKLLFMGGELAPERDWAHEATLDWSLHDEPGHEGIRLWLTTLNRLYCDLPALHEGDCDPEGFRWAVQDDAENAVFAYLRTRTSSAARSSEAAGSSETPDKVLFVMNATPNPIEHYRVGVPVEGCWTVLANSDDAEFGGSGYVTATQFDTVPVPGHGEYQSLSLSLPPLGAMLLAPPTS